MKRISKTICVEETCHLSPLGKIDMWANINVNYMRIPSVKFVVAFSSYFNENDNSPKAQTKTQKNCNQIIKFYSLNIKSP